MKDHDYNYIVIDDCWSVKDKRDSNVWLAEDIADFKTELPLTVKPHETVLLKITS